MSTSLARGAKAGVQVAVSPLVTDTVIIALALTVVSQLPPAVVTGLTLLGALVVGYFAWETWRAARSPNLARQLAVPDPDSGNVGVTATPAVSPELAKGGGVADAPRRATQQPRPAWLQGIVVNFLNPAAWLFWATAGAALLIDFWRTSPLQAVLFLATFYLMLVGTKVLLALGVAAGRERMSMRTYRWLLVGSALLLAAVALSLVVSAISSR